MAFLRVIVSIYAIKIATAQFSCTPLCLNGGSCRVSSKGARCYCPPVWTGRSCSECLCQNRGQCSGPDSCSCPPARSGPRCEQCECLNGGVCVGSDCRCLGEGYFGGDRCEHQCHPRCKNGGKCMAGNKCSCPAGWLGPDCSIYACESRPCQNGGSCIGINQCSCPKNTAGAQYYGGPACEHACDIPCQYEGNLCTGRNQCTCKSPYQGKDCSLRPMPEYFLIGNAVKLVNYEEAQQACAENRTGGRLATMKNDAEWEFANALWFDQNPYKCCSGWFGLKYNEKEDHWAWDDTGLEPEKYFWWFDDLKAGANDATIQPGMCGTLNAYMPGWSTQKCGDSSRGLMYFPLCMIQQ